MRAGQPGPEQGEPFLPRPVFAAPFHVRGDPTDTEFVYGRYGNPTWSNYERALGELEGGEAVLFSSGMAACSAVLLPSLRPGDTVVIPSDCYMHVRGVARDHLAPRGVDVRFVPTAELSAEQLPDGLRLLWVESPSNPGLELCDVSALAAAAHERGAAVAVDNTFSTPLGQLPLDLGADFSIMSATKHLSGHADLLLGYVATGDPARAEELRHWRRARAQSLDRSRSGWRTARSRPSRFGSSGAVPTRRRWRSCSRRGER